MSAGRESVSGIRPTTSAPVVGSYARPPHLEQKASVAPVSSTHVLHAVPPSAAKQKANSVHELKRVHDWSTMESDTKSDQPWSRSAQSRPWHPEIPASRNVRGDRPSPLSAVMPRPDRGSGGTSGGTGGTLSSRTLHQAKLQRMGACVTRMRLLCKAPASAQKCSIMVVTSYREKCGWQNLQGRPEIEPHEAKISKVVGHVSNETGADGKPKIGVDRGKEVTAEDCR